MVVGHERKEIIRSQYDLEKDTCKYHKKATKVGVHNYIPRYMGLILFQSLDPKLLSEVVKFAKQHT